MADTEGVELVQEAADGWYPVVLQFDPPRTTLQLSVARATELADELRQATAKLPKHPLASTRQPVEPCWVRISRHPTEPTVIWESPHPLKRLPLSYYMIWATHHALLDQLADIRQGSFSEHHCREISTHLHAWFNPQLVAVVGTSIYQRQDGTEVEVTNVDGHFLHADHADTEECRGLVLGFQNGGFVRQARRDSRWLAATPHASRGFQHGVLSIHGSGSGSSGPQIFEADPATYEAISAGLPITGTGQLQELPSGRDGGG